MASFTPSDTILSDTITSQVASNASSLPLYRRVQHRLLAVCIMLAPLTVTGYLLSWISVNGAGLTYSHSIAALGTLTNQLHMTLGILAAIFLPLGFLGMALLGMKRSPWLATGAAILALVGWAPFAGIVSIDILAYDVARAGSSPQLIALWTQFNSDPAIMSLQYIYIIGHLLSAVLIGILLGKARLIPAWAALVFLLSSPYTMALFAFHVAAQLAWTVGLLFLIGAVPAAIALWNGKGDAR